MATPSGSSAGHRALEARGQRPGGGEAERGRSRDPRHREAMGRCDPQHQRQEDEVAQAEDGRHHARPGDGEADRQQRERALAGGDGVGGTRGVDHAATSAAAATAHAGSRWPGWATRRPMPPAGGVRHGHEAEVDQHAPDRRPGRHEPGHADAGQPTPGERTGRPGREPLRGPRRDRQREEPCPGAAREVEGGSRPLGQREARGHDRSDRRAERREEQAERGDERGPPSALRHGRPRCTASLWAS